jgi:hypothetical protein
LVSAWNSFICGCVAVVMAFQSVCFTESNVGVGRPG